MRPTTRPRRFALVGLVAMIGLGAAACGDDDSDEPSAATEAPAPTDAPAPTEAPAPSAPAELSGTVNLGYFPNVTHAPALVGIARETFAEALGAGVTINPFTFNAGTEAVEALFAGSLDITFIGPNPAINGFAQSGGEALRIIAGSTSGGAYLVTRPELTSAEQLVGTTIATPSLGNTQDVALRAWLAENGIETTPDGGGDVTILPQSNASTLESFINGQIDGAWVPEPWATRLILEGGGAVLVDERDLWPETDGEYVTTHVIVRTEFLEEHPDLVRAFLVGLIEAQALIASDPAAAQLDVIDQIELLTDQRPSEEVIGASFENLTFTLDPIAVSLQGSADDAVAVGLLEPVDLSGIYDLTILNELLTEQGEVEVSGL